MTASYLRAKQLCRNFHGIGLGLRWEFLDDLLSQQPKEIDFLEFSPENYMGRGGYFPASLERLSHFYPLLSHGLTMSVGSAHLPDEGYFKSLREELKKSRSPIHSDHLSLGQVGPLQLHELLPLPRTPQYVGHVADHIAAIEERLQCPFLIENISSYVDIEAEGMAEVDFITAILERSNSGLLL
ncbi:MAG: DUF692 domain-containing protein, partial [Polyangiaceae bacterium]|nr:DUF692 domain-containing protein [Polyangiaceae bacterium]